MKPLFTLVPKILPISIVFLTMLSSGSSFAEPLPRLIRARKLAGHANELKLNFHPPTGGRVPHETLRQSVQRLANFSETLEDNLLLPDEFDVQITLGGHY